MRRLRLANRAADRRLRCASLTLREPQQRKARLECLAVLGGSTVGEVGVGEFASQPVELRELVERRAVAPLAGALGFRRRLGPCAAESQQLHTMHEAYPAKRHEIWLCVAPPRQRVGPFAGASEIKQGMAALDHGAVDGADADRRHIADRDRDHDFVEQRGSRGCVPARRHDLRKAQSTEDLEIGIVETPCELGGSSGCVVRAVDVLFVDAHAGG